MHTSRVELWARVAAAVAIFVLSQTNVSAADPPAAPPVSKFAPAKDLAAQVDFFLVQLDKSLANDAEYDETKKDRVNRDANTIAVLALTLGMHDEKTAFKAAAPGLIEAAGKLVAAHGDFNKATAALADLKKAVTGNASGDLAWTKVADLSVLMKQVPVVNSRLRRGVRKTKLKRDKEKTVGYSATLAAIAQASMADTSAVEKPEDQAKWYEFCAAMRDAAGEANAAIHKQDADAVKKAMTRLKESCERCHEVFRDE